MDFTSNNTLNIAFLNLHGQTGFSVTKQKQVEDFIRRNCLDILHCQEINIDEESFSQCSYITSNFFIISNNAQNKFGTASIINNTFTVENIKMDTIGRAIFFDIENTTLGNVYLHSGTDSMSRGGREQFCSENIPQLLVNCKENGCWGGDLNCIVNVEDCTNNPNSKKSPSLARLIRNFAQVDSFRSLHPGSQVFSRYYSGANGEIGASRIDRSYHWGNLSVVVAEYLSVAFSDHMSFVVRLSLPGLDKIISPKTRPHFKTSPEVIHDKVFRRRLVEEMVGWQQVKERGLKIMSWWELIVKPGIRRLAINRSKELNKQRRSELNCLLLKQSYFTRELQAGDKNRLGQLKEIKTNIVAWYERESRKIILQSRVDDVQQSEKVRIFHHEQHKKHCKKSSILKLETENGLLEGHDACSAYLEDQIGNLLLHPAVLDPHAQAILLAEITPVFTEADNLNLKKLPGKTEVKEVLFQSNTNAAPGTDGITSLLYKEHWDLLGQSLHQVVTAIHKGENLTCSQRTSLMVFGTKPKKLSSIKPSDKRRISLLNSDFKLVTGLEAARFKQTFTHTLSPVQMVAGNDRRIHHMINKARDCIYAVSKSKLGCAMLDLDFVAAFDNLVFSWVFAVLRAKGVSEPVISRIARIYDNCITIPVVNNIHGRPLNNIRGSLRQGCPGSMGWFGVAIDPLLIFLLKKLSGIPICSLPTLGPCLENGSQPQPVTEVYKVFGYADDIKPAVTTMAEFAVVDQAASLFEKSSGCSLHRDPATGKCKVLPLGRWKNNLQQEDIGLPYLKICDSLSMVGVELTASWQSTRKINNDDLQLRVQKLHWSLEIRQTPPTCLQTLQYQHILS